MTKLPQTCINFWLMRGWFHEEASSMFSKGFSEVHYEQAYELYRTVLKIKRDNGGSK